MSDTAAVVGWFAQERGIRQETLGRFGIGVRPDGVVVLPYARGHKDRHGIPHGDRKFFFTGDVGLYNEQDVQASLGTPLILVEGETDTMRLWQELQDAGRGNELIVAGLPGIDTWNVPGTHEVRPSILAALERASSVYVIFDNDSDYAVQGRVDTAFKAIRQALGRGKVKRVRLPLDVKDVCEFFSRYDLTTLDDLLAAPEQARSRFRPLDLTGDPPPVNWLVEGLLCRGDNHLLMGEPGIGKSWISMSATIAVVQGTNWLGRPVTGGPQRVLYLDEENPEDLIFQRLRKLGMTPEDATRIRYLNNIGLRLDRNPDDLLDEALEFAPSLIVLDSLTRFHTGDEDKAGFMAALYNDALKPLARETGAAVLLLHHANKSDSNSSYRRSRGSGEIIANADCGYDLRLAGINLLTMAKFKSRRGAAGDVIHIGIIDDPATGGVQVRGDAALGAPF